MLNRHDLQIATALVTLVRPSRPCFHAVDTISLCLQAVARPVIFNKTGPIFQFCLVAPAKAIIIYRFLGAMSLKTRLSKGVQHSLIPIDQFRLIEYNVRRGAQVRRVTYACSNYFSPFYNMQQTPFLRPAKQSIWCSCPRSFAHVTQIVHSFFLCNTLHKSYVA